MSMLIQVLSFSTRRWPQQASRYDQGVVNNTNWSQAWARVHASAGSHPSKYQWKYQFQSGPLVLFWGPGTCGHDNGTSLLS